MKKHLALLIIVPIILICVSFMKNSNGQSQSSDCQCVTDALAATKAIKIGLKRKDLDKMFRLDGGISPINPERFVYQKCPFIKIEVKFEFVDKENKFPKQNPEDKIIEVSRPYLEEPFDD